jgi:hypothetical protein
MLSNISFFALQALLSGISFIVSPRQTLLSRVGLQSRNYASPEQPSPPQRDDKFSLAVQSEHGHGDVVGDDIGSPGDRTTILWNIDGWSSSQSPDLHLRVRDKERRP